MWEVDHHHSERSVAVFWLGDRPIRHTFRHTDVGLGDVNDLWRGDLLGAADLDIPAHGTRVLRVRRR